MNDANLREVDDLDDAFVGKLAEVEAELGHEIGQIEDDEPEDGRPIEPGSAGSFIQSRMSRASRAALELEGFEFSSKPYAPPSREETTSRAEGVGVLVATPPPPVADPVEPTVASIVSAALAREFVDEIDWGVGGERTHVWASGYRECARAMALDLLFPEDRGKLSGDSCARMALGKDFEANLRARLERAGRRSDPRFEVEGAQEHWKLYHREHPERVVLTGKTDGKIRIEGARKGVVFEIKRGDSFKRCRTVDDLLAGRWSAAAVYQALGYLLGVDLAEAVIIIDSGGVPTLIPIRLEDHRDKAEAFLAAAEVASECKHDGRQLPGFAENPELCDGCDHRGKSCAPPWFSGEGPWVSSDPGLVEVVETCLRTREAAREYGRGWERLKTLCRGLKLVLIGGHTITGKACGNGWKLKLEGGPPLAEARDCTCLGSCKGAAGLSKAWRCCKLPVPVVCLSDQAERDRTTAIRSLPIVEEGGLAEGAWPAADSEILAEAERWARHGVKVERLENS